MRVLVAHGFYRRAGGEDAYVRRQVELLAERHDVELLERSNVDLESGPSTAANMVYSRRSIREAEAAIERFRPDIVHLHNAYPSWGPAIHLAAERRSVPLIVTVHNLRLRCPNGLMFTEGALCRRCEGGITAHAVIHRCFERRSQAAAYATALWVHRFAVRLEKRVALYIAPSIFMKKRLLEWGFPEERVALARSYGSAPVETGSESPEAGLYLGRLSSEKGLDVLLRALGETGDPPFRIVGDGPRREELVELARSLRLSNVTFTGWVPPAEALRELAAARYVALPSLCEENAPLAALDALAAGKPLVVSDRGGLPELADEGRGLVSAAGDPGALARDVRAVVTDDDRCRSMSEASRAFAGATLTPRAHLEALEDAYSRVV